MARLSQRIGSENIYRTDEHGTIEFITDGERLWVKTEKQVWTNCKTQAGGGTGVPDYSPPPPRRPITPQAIEDKSKITLAANQNVQVRSEDSSGIATPPRRIPPNTADIPPRMPKTKAAVSISRDLLLTYWLNSSGHAPALFHHVVPI